MLALQELGEVGPAGCELAVATRRGEEAAGGGRGGRGEVHGEGLDAAADLVGILTGGAGIVHFCCEERARGEIWMRGFEFCGGLYGNSK